MPHLTLSEEDFIRTSNNFSGFKTRSLNFDYRKFRGLFSVSPKVCSDVWEKVYLNIDSGAEPKHLLWGFLFLKVYSTEHVHCSIVGTSPKTFRKWSWYFVHVVSDLKVVSYFFILL